LAEHPPKQLLIPLGQRDHYLLGEAHSLTQKLPSSFPLFSFSLLSSLFTTRAPSLETKTCVVFWNLCEEDGGRRWQFIGGRGGRAGALYRWAGAHLWCPSWLPFLHFLLCLTLTQNNGSWVVVGRWKSAGEWSYVGGSNNVMGCVRGVVYDM